MAAGLADLVGFGLGAGWGFFREGADLGAGALGLAFAAGLAAAFALAGALTGALAGALAGGFPFGAIFPA